MILKSLQQTCEIGIQLKKKINHAFHGTILLSLNKFITVSYF